jgi:hypothetical protein
MAGTNWTRDIRSRLRRFVTSIRTLAHQSPAIVWCQLSNSPGTVAVMSMPDFLSLARSCCSQRCVGRATESPEWVGWCPG